MQAIHLFAAIAGIFGLALLWLRVPLFVWFIFAVIVTLLAQTGLYFPSNQPLLVLDRYWSNLLTSPTQMAGWIPAALLLIAVILKPIVWKKK